MKLSIVILNYNKHNLTLKCLNSLYGKYSKEFDGGIFELIVVDNGSRDLDVSELSKNLEVDKYKNLKLVKNIKNVGFSKGCNIGAKVASGSCILFLNNE